MSRTLASALEDHRGLGLLLVLSSSAGCLGLPRFEQPDDGSEGGNETGFGTDADETGPTPTSAGPGPGPTSGPLPTGGPLPTTITTTGPGPSPTTTSTSGPMPTVTTTPPPPVLDVGLPTYNSCAAYAELAEYCYGSGESAYEFCNDYLTYLENEQPECAPILDAFFACLSTLECGELFEPGSPCEPLFELFFECRDG
ncbi:MAG: hypothetical protein AAGF11_41400 [Myxococcota bacterium]